MTWLLDSRVRTVEERLSSLESEVRTLTRRIESLELEVSTRLSHQDTLMLKHDSELLALDTHIRELTAALQIMLRVLPEDVRAAVQTVSTLEGLAQEIVQDSSA